MCPVSSPTLGVHVKFFSKCSPPSVESEVRKWEGECCPPDKRQRYEKCVQKRGGKVARLRQTLALYLYANKEVTLTTEVIFLPGV